MKKMNNNVKIIILIGIVFIIIFVIFYFKKIEENSYNEYSYQEYFEEQENKIIEDKKTIIVYITGEVNKPGVIELEEGKRIVDAINAAGGTTLKAALNQINLAYLLKDGMKIYVPNVEDKNIEYITTNIGDSSSKEKININMANEKDLQKLPGVGESTAKKIIKYREENGEFKNIEDIKNIKGIGESKYEELKDKIEI